MELHELKAPQGARKRKKIVGRGRASGSGKTSGRGENGQRSRSTGRYLVASSEGGQMPLIRRLPKVGFRSHRPICYQVVHLGDLDRKCEAGEVITAKALKEKGLIKRLSKPFKILADGDIQKSLTIRQGALSRTAKEKIERAGGKVEIKEKRAEKKG